MKRKFPSIGKVDKQMSDDISKALSADNSPKGLKPESLGKIYSPKELIGKLLKENKRLRKALPLLFNVQSVIKSTIDDNKRLKDCLNELKPYIDDCLKENNYKLKSEVIENKYRL